MGNTPSFLIRRKNKKAQNEPSTHMNHYSKGTMSPELKQAFYRLTTMHQNECTSKELMQVKAILEQL